MMLSAEASLEGVPTTISPIATTTRSRIITPPADLAELWENANKALEELLATKSSIDAHRWRAVWELGRELHWNESETVESIKEVSHLLPCYPGCWGPVLHNCQGSKGHLCLNCQRSQGHLHLHHPGG